MTHEEIRVKLLNAVTEYDRKQSTKKCYNRYALAQYIAQIDNVIRLHQEGSALKWSIRKCYLDRLCAAVGKEFGIKYTNDEIKWGVLNRD